MNAKKLSNAQYRLIEEIRRKGKVRCEDRIRKTYNKLIEMGLVDYDHSYDYIVLTSKGKEIDL
jgi:Mn-dependent DtxR family transcriptional regulator